MKEAVISSILGIVFSFVGFIGYLFDNEVCMLISAFFIALKLIKRLCDKKRVEYLGWSLFCGLFWWLSGHGEREFWKSMLLSFSVYVFTADVCELISATSTEPQNEKRVKTVSDVLEAAIPIVLFLVVLYNL